MKTKRNFLISILTMVMAMCAFMGVLGVTNVDSVKAEGQTFYVDNSFSVKIDEGAIRFYTVMDAETKALAEENGYGFFIFPNSYYTELTTLDKADFHTTLTKRVEIEGNANGTSKIYKYDESLYATNAVIKNLQYESFGIEFTCVAFVDNGDGTYTYAYNESLSVSAQEELSAMYLSGLEDVDYETMMVTYGDHADETRTNYSFGKDNPILITNESQIGVIASNVSDSVNTYEGLNFKLAENITLANGATIPSAFAGSIDGNGKKVTADFAAVLVEGKTATELNYVEDINAPAKFLTITDETWTAGVGGYIYNKNTADDYVSAEDVAAANISGDYVGSAVRWTVGGANDDWKIKNDYTPAQLQNISKYYDYARFYLAMTIVDEENPPLNGADGNADAGWYAGFGEGLIQYAQETVSNKRITFNANRLNQWYSLTVPVESFITHISDVGEYQYIGTHWFQQNLKSNMETKVYLYISEIEFVGLTDIFKIEENDFEKIYNSSSNSTTFVANADIPEEIKGEYTGNAVVINQTGTGNQGTFTLDLSHITEGVKSRISNEYNYVRLWVAIALENNPNVAEDVYTAQYNTLGTGLLRTSLGMDDTTTYTLKYNQWYSFLVPVDEFFDYVGENTAVTLLTSYNSSDKLNRNYYFGDVELCHLVAGFDKVRSWEGSAAEQKDNYNIGGAPVYHNWYYTRATWNRSLINNGFTGDYVGSAVYQKYGTAGTGSNNDYVRITNTYTDAELEKLAKQYNSVRFYLAIDDQRAAENVPEGWYFTIGGGLMDIVNETTAYGDDGVKAYQFTAADDLKWIEFTVDMDKYVEYAKGKSFVDFYKRLENSNSNLWLYTSSIEFTNITAE